MSRQCFDKVKHHHFCIVRYVMEKLNFLVARIRVNLEHIEVTESWRRGSQNFHRRCSGIEANLSTVVCMRTT